MIVDFTHAEVILIREKIKQDADLLDELFPRDMSYYDSIPGKGDEVEFFATIHRYHDRIDVCRAILAKLDNIPEE